MRIAKALSPGVRASLLLPVLAVAACGKPPASSAPAAADATPAPASAPAPVPPPSSPAATVADASAAAPATAPAAVTPVPKGPPVQVTPELVAEGKKLFFSIGCNACHGGTGGGGMCPPLTNEIWVYGSDDDTLRALINEGTPGMVAHGLPRVGHERVVGQMPPFAPVLKPGDTEKLLAFIHSINKSAGTPK